MATSADVQSAVDALAAAYDRSVLIEDDVQHPVWWSTRGAVDPTRLKTILNREVPPPVAAIVQRFHLDRVSIPVHTPAMPEVGMWPRWCVPVRQHGRFLGMLWILDPDESITMDSLPPATECAALAARVLGQDRRTAEQVRLMQDEQVDALLRGPDEDAARELARLHQVPHDVLVQVSCPGVSGGWPLPAGMSLHVVGRTPRLATSGTPVPLVQLGEAVRRAALTARAVRAGARLDPPTWDHLGLWRLVVEAPESVTPGSVHPAAAILAAQSRDDLVSTARVVLDNGGDVATAAAELHVHRTTLYYRFRRIRELTGVDVLDGRTRTHLQPALWLAAYRDTA